MKKVVVLKAITWLLCKTIGVVAGYLLTCGWIKIATLIIGCQFSWSTATIIFIIYNLIKITTAVIAELTK